MLKTLENRTQTVSIPSRGSGKGDGLESGLNFSEMEAFQSPLGEVAKETGERPADHPNGFNPLSGKWQRRHNATLNPRFGVFTFQSPLGEVAKETQYD